jgi:glutamine amidotransferase
VNGDGFGVGWYDAAPTDDETRTNEHDDEPCVFTSIQPAWNNVNLARLARKLRSPLIFAHVRAAYPGMPASEVNCHPFVYGRYMWMHNGAIACFAHLRRTIESQLPIELYLSIQGKSDSEAAFALFLSRLPSTSERLPSAVLRLAMRETLDALCALVAAELTARPPDAPPEFPSLLNFVVSDGQCIIATRYVDSRTVEPATLYFASGTSFEGTKGGVAAEYRMAHTCAQQRAVILASEPLSGSLADWVTVPRNSIVTIEADNGAPTAERVPALRVLIEPIARDETGAEAICAAQAAATMSVVAEDAAGEEIFAPRAMLNVQQAPPACKRPPAQRQHLSDATTAFGGVAVGELKASVLSLARITCARAYAEPDASAGGGAPTSLLLAGATGGLIRMYDPRSLERVGELQGHERGVLAFLSVPRLQHRAPRCPAAATADAPGACVDDALVTSSSLLLSASADSSLRLWDVGALACRLVIETRGMVHSLELVSLDAGGRDAESSAHHRTHGEQEEKKGGGAGGEDEERMVCIGCQDSTIRCISLAELLAPLELAGDADEGARAPETPEALPCAGACALDGGGGHQGGPGPGSGAAIPTRSLAGLTGCTLRGHTGYVLALRACGRRWLCSGGGDGLLMLWRRARAATSSACQLELEHALRAHDGSVLCVQSDDERARILSGGADGLVRVWDCSGADGPNAAPAPLRTLCGHDSAVSALALTGRGQLLSADARGCCRVWDASLLTCLQRLVTEPPPLAPVARAEGTELRGFRCSAHELRPRRLPHVNRLAQPGSREPAHCAACPPGINAIAWLPPAPPDAKTGRGDRNAHCALALCSGGVLTLEDVSRARPLA